LTLLRDVLNLPSQMLLYLIAVVVVARVGGLAPALAAAVAAAVLLDHYFVPPLYDFDVADPDNVVALVAFVLVAGAVGSVVGLAARRTQEAETLATANAASREELRVLADEQGRRSSPASATAPTSRRWAAASTSSRRCLWRSPCTRAVRPLDDFSQATDATATTPSAGNPVGGRSAHHEEAHLALGRLVRGVEQDRRAGVMAGSATAIAAPRWPRSSTAHPAGCFFETSARRRRMRAGGGTAHIRGGRRPPHTPAGGGTACTLGGIRPKAGTPSEATPAGRAQRQLSTTLPVVLTSRR
jgi:hypothetical protein